MRDLPPWIRGAGNAFSHGKARAGRKRERQLAGNEPQLADRFGEREVRSGALHENPGEHVERDDRPGKERRALSLVFVAVRKHVDASSVVPRPNRHAAAQSA